MLKEEKIAKLIEARKDWQQKKDVAYNSFLYEQERIMKQIEDLQNELKSRQIEWQKQKQDFDAILFTYDTELKQGIKDDDHHNEEYHDDTDK